MLPHRNNYEVLNIKVSQRWLKVHISSLVEGLYGIIN